MGNPAVVINAKPHSFVFGGGLQVRKLKQDCKVKF